MICLSALQVVGLIAVVVALGILIGAVIGYTTPDKNGDPDA